VGIANAAETGSNEPVEYVRYSAYGEAIAYPAADVNMDGSVSTADQTDWNSGTPSGNYALGTDYDLNRDGTVDAADTTFFNASYTANTATSGRGRMSSLSVGNRKGYAGYEFDEAASVYHVRHRVYLPEAGRWTRRDPLGYVDGMGLYEYVKARAVRSVDPTGKVPDDNLAPVEPWPDRHEPPEECTRNLSEALQHPRVVAIMAEAAAACPGTPAPTVSLDKCGDENEEGWFQCSLLGNPSSIGVCYSDRCPSVNSMVNTIVHEYTHFMQYCRAPIPGIVKPEQGQPGTGDDSAGSCWHFRFQASRTRNEMEAYCRESTFTCPPPGGWLANEWRAESLCRAVERSGGSYSLCMFLLGFPCKFSSCVTLGRAGVTAYD
jgi:RHS repeat-associated protein